MRIRQTHIYVEAMNYLIVVAHPDDEVLGAGATIYKLTQQGHNVDICFMCSKAEARSVSVGEKELEQEINNISQLLAIRKRYEGSFPNIKMNTCSHLSLVQFIEKAIVDSECDVIITHHPADPNNDHMHTSLACQAAMRLFQRRNGVKPLQEFLYMEVLSSTEWSVNTSMRNFTPNTFIEANEESLSIKIQALKSYHGVAKPLPHPRSAEAIKALAIYRGIQAGYHFAEAFELVLRRL